MISAETSLDEIRTLYAHGLYRQAFEVGKSLGPMTEWPGTGGRIIAGRLAGNLGAIKMTRVLHRLAYRNDPGDWEARYYICFLLLDRHGPLRTWQFIERAGIPDDSVPALHRADWFLMQARVLSQVRDFESADAAQSRAETINPEHPWTWVERANLYERQDQFEKAVEAIRHAISLGPDYRPAIQSAAHLFINSGREEEALQLLIDATNRMESGHLWVQRAVLESELGHHRQSAEAFERAIEFLPLIEKSYSRWLFARLADETYELGEMSRAVQYARGVEDELYSRFADAMAQENVDFRRKSLEVGFVRQQHVGCAPATLSALARFWNRPFDHLQVVERICYDGTPAHSERRWAQENGFLAREFTVTWDSARALIDRGCPFTLTTVGTLMGHLQAVIGYDECRRSLTIRDPGSRMSSEFEIDSLLKAHELSGPRGMTMIPVEESHRLEGVVLPDAELYDHFYHVLEGLERHDRESARNSVQALDESSPDHRLTLFAKRALASYDGDAATGLSIVTALSERYPNDVNLQLSRLRYLQDLAASETRLAFLQERYRAANGDTVFWRMLAQELTLDAREIPEARRILRRTLRYRREDAEAYRTLANILWDECRQDATLLYRWASCLDDKNEDHARTYFIACRHLRQEELGHRLLRDRFGRFSRQSGWPARTLCWALEELNREEEMFQVIDEALTCRPDDGDLLLYAADLHHRLNRPERGQALLERAESRVHRSRLLQTKARVAGFRGDLQVALAHWRDAAECEPLNVDAHASIAGLLHDCQSLTAAIDYLREVAIRFPFHLPIQQLLVHWLRSGRPDESVATLQRLLAAYPTDAWAYRELALTLIKLERVPEAFAAAETARELEPKNSGTYIVLGRLQQIAGEVELAKSAYRESLQLSIDGTVALDGLLSCCRTDEERRVELAWIQHQLATQTTFGDGLLSYRTLATGVLDPAALLQVLQEARVARPDLWQTGSALIEQLLEMQRFDEAHEVALQSTDRFPMLPKCWADLASVCAARQDKDGEILALEQGLSLNPAFNSVSFRLAEAYQARGDIDKALSILEQAATRDPSDAHNHGCLADVLWKVGKQERAVDHLKLAVRLHPGYEWGWDTIGTWLDELNRSDELLALAETVTADRPGEARSWMVLGRMRARQGMREEAIADYSRAIVLNPVLVEAHDQRAALLADMQKFDEAILACESPVWRGDAPVTLLGRAADIQFRRGDTAGAAEQMKAILATHTDYAWGWYRLAGWLDTLGGGEEYCKACRELVRSSPHWAVAHGFLADAEDRFGDGEIAFAEFEKAFSLDPTYTFAGNRLVKLLMPDDPGRAREILVRMREAAPTPWVFRQEIESGLAMEDDLLVTGGFERLCRCNDDSGQLAWASSHLMTTSYQGQLIKLVEEIMAQPNPNQNLGIAWMRLQRSDRPKLSWLKQAPADSVLWHNAAADLLDEVADQGRPNTLEKIIQTHKSRLLSNTELWAKCGRALHCNGQFKRSLQWFGDWKQRSNVEPWMISNLALTLWSLGKYDLALQTSRESLAFPNDHTTGIHKSFLAAGEAFEGDPAMALKTLSEIDESELSDYYQAMFRMVAAAATQLTHGSSGKESFLADRKAVRQSLRNSLQLLSTDKIVMQIYRRLMMRLSSRRRNWVAFAWYKVQGDIF